MRPIQPSFRFLSAILAFAALLTPSAAFSAEPDLVSYLNFRHVSREARNRIFLARLEEGAASIALARANFVLSTTSRLVQSRSVSLFEHFDAMLAVMKARFEKERGEHHIAVATQESQIADLQAEWALSGRPDPRRLAVLYVDFRKSRIAMLKVLIASLEPYADTLSRKHRASQDLLATRSTSQDEANVHQVAADSANGLVTLAHKELAYAEKELAEAEAELNRINRAPNVSPPKEINRVEPLGSAPR